MRPHLSVSSSLEHDGDELVRYTVALQSAEFSAATAAWGNVGEHLELAEVLKKFPGSPESSVKYQFGTPGTGTCELYFHCTDSLGHLGVWAVFESTYPAGRTERHESASIFMRCDPSGIDEFVAGLRRFVAGSANRAVLYGIEA